MALVLMVVASCNLHHLFLHLLVVHFVIDVQSDFLGGDDGLHADIHITIRVIVRSPVTVNS